MKSSKISVLLLCAAMALSASVGCEKNDSKSKNSNSGGSSVGTEDHTNPGYEDATNNVPQSSANTPDNEVKQISAEINEEAGANETLFKLNSVVETEVIENGMKYIYLNVDISNSTDEDYSLSALNNLYLLHGQNYVEISDLVTLFYARNNFQNITVNQDPITVPANGTFSGFLCGFEVPGDLYDFTVGFYPTQNDSTNKSTAIEVKITKDDIKKISNGMIS